MTIKIMMVDDDLNICKVTSIYLQKAGYEVVFAYDGEQALKLFEQIKVDAIILDLMLPIIDGMKVCETIRRASTVPIIMLTAKGQQTDKIEGLQLGADDYIVKPFDPNELIARLQAVLRRTQIDKKISSADLISIGELEINTMNHTVALNSHEIKLPKKEYELLLFLAKHPNRVFSRDELIEMIWGWDFEGEDRVVDLYIKRLRSKLSKAENQSISIKTVWGVGYQLEASSS
ncbi:response regulator transcription factor [Pseudoneobacillus rhizosphaerae]|jgi:DNA-binding response OmpR family regulator|uniref:Heme response regulator HssR n=1 Tax=Pseudoneobacillus rhizosphaerae TaxID=2880968 RepID=A0A9C7GAD2_9BACI|nr:response regulator transcription factor [Pseudoneobacillus rhizosphaerae]CAG9608528.1 Transcriptional regulatory protein SrrA [Pseudoneobacillus rhizosphaerae]